MNSIENNMKQSELLPAFSKTNTVLMELIIFLPGTSSIILRRH